LYYVIQVREYRFAKAERGKRLTERVIEGIRCLQCASCLLAALGSAPSPETSACQEQRILAAALEALAAIIDGWGCKVDCCLPAACSIPAHCAQVEEDAAGILVLASSRMQKLRRMQLVQDLPRFSRGAAPVPSAETPAHAESSALESVIRAVSKCEEQVVTVTGHDEFSSSSDHTALFDALYLCITSCVKGFTSTKSSNAKATHAQCFNGLAASSDSNTCTHQRPYIGGRMRTSSRQ
jgi:hypothetical protein